MGLIAQVTVSLDVPSSPGAPGLGLPRTGVALASWILLACALAVAGLLVVASTRTSRQRGDSG